MFPIGERRRTQCPELLSSEAPPANSGVPRQPPEARARIAVIDTDPAGARSLGRALELDGYDVTVALDPWRGVMQIRAQPSHLVPDLVVLGDALLHAALGYFERVLSTLIETPILLLASRSYSASELPAFRLGFDDIVVRPVRVAELHRRIDILAERRRGAAPAPLRVTDGLERVGDVVIDTRARQAYRDSSSVTLTPLEFSTLEKLVARRGAVVRHEELLAGAPAGVSARSTRSLILALRKKLERNRRQPELILTVRKAGYRIVG